MIKKLIPFFILVLEIAKIGNAGILSGAATKGVTITHIPVAHKALDWRNNPILLNDFASITVTRNGQNLYRMPYYILSYNDVPLSGIGNFTASEIDIVNKAANFWNNAGSYLFFENGGTWANDYSTIKISIGNIKETNDFLYPCGIIKVTQILLYNGTPTFPIITSSSAELGLTNYFDIPLGTPNLARPWEVLLNFVNTNIGNFVPSFDPTNIYEADIRNSQTKKFSMTKTAAHELGHTIGLNHDNYIYDTKFYSGWNFKQYLLEAHNPFGNTACTGVYSGLRMTRDPYFKDSDGKVYQAAWQNTNFTICGQTVTAVGYKLVVSATSINDDKLFYWHKNIMSTAETDEDGITGDNNLIDSYLFYGSSSFLNPITSFPCENRSKYSPSYAAIHQCYGWQPSFPNQNLTIRIKGIAHAKN